MSLVALGLILLALGLATVYTTFPESFGLSAIAGYPVDLIAWVLVGVGAVLVVLGFVSRPAYGWRGYRRYPY